MKNKFKIKGMIEKTQFQLDGNIEEDENNLLFFTRENGCVNSETAGHEDVGTAYILKAEIKKLKCVKSVEVEEVGEFVHINVEVYG